jgi:hypothetical protein
MTILRLKDEVRRAGMSEEEVVDRKCSENELRNSIIPTEHTRVAGRTARLLIDRGIGIAYVHAGPLHEILP